MKALHYFLSLLIVLVLFSCNPRQARIITVNGEIPPSAMGKTLHHEHLLVDFIGADSTGYHRWDKNEVVEKVLPYLMEIKKLGYKTLVECTPAYLGRDPELLKLLSEKSGIQILTNTGYYSAGGGKFIPAHGFTETAEQLAQRWIAEAQNGIEETGVFPGFIKIAVDAKPLEEINRKVVEAACITHKATGLTIMSHTGPAVPAFEELEILKKNGVHPSAFIWTHAQNEKNIEKYIDAAKMGAWVAFDNFNPKYLDRYLEVVLRMKTHGLLQKVLLSHDAGWYKPGEPDGGDFRGFTDIEEIFIPALEKNGLSQHDIYELFVTNPAEAFKIQVRLL